MRVPGRPPVRPFVGVMLLGLLGLAGCSSQQVATEGIEFQVTAAANRNTPVALDLVLVYDPGLATKIGKLSAAQWFHQREEIQQRNPQMLLSWSWEMVPGRSPDPFVMPDEAEDALGIFLFAGYGIPGLHSARLDPYKRVLIRLEENAMRVYPIETY